MSLCRTEVVDRSTRTLSIQVVSIGVGVPILFKIASVLLPRAVGIDSIIGDEAIAATSLALGQALVSTTHRGARVVPFEPLLGIHPYLRSVGSHCLSGA